MEVSPQVLFNASIMDAQPLELVDKSIQKTVKVITKYGYEFEGTFLGSDLSVNFVLENATERSIIDPMLPVRQHKLVLINGGTVSLIVPDQPKFE